MNNPKSFYYSFLRGSSISELDKMSSDGDIRHLAKVGKNLMLMQMAAETEAAGRIADQAAAARREADAAAYRAEIDRVEEERQAMLKEEAVSSARRSRIYNNGKPRDGAENVDSFLDSF